MRRRPVACLIPVLLLAAALPAWADGADLDRQVERGERLYEIYCSNCHGKTGRGDGPTAEHLKVAPTDLTLLTARNEGEFPTARVVQLIDGRATVRGHGQRSMPIWGMVFQQPDLDTGQEDEVRGRVLALSEYLRGIQRER